MNKNRALKIEEALSLALKNRGTTYYVVRIGNKYYCHSDYTIRTVCLKTDAVILDRITIGRD